MSNKNNKKKQHKTVYSQKTKTSPAITNQSETSNLVAQSKFTAKLITISDWHIGCGAGRTGDIDSLVQRDKDDLPYIPAKTLTGIWRDACELVAFGLDEGQENGVWQQWVDYLFGEQPAISTTAVETAPRHAALSIRAAHLPSTLQQALKEKLQLKQALTFVKPGISIDPLSGCAKKDYLRFEEMVRGGGGFEAKCELNLPENDEDKLAAYALLMAGTQLVEKLGGKRRRGTGKCQLVVEEKQDNVNAWINWIEANLKPNCPPDLSTKSFPSHTQDVPAIENEPWLYIPLKITAKSPVIVAKRTIGNIVESQDYIPGTHLLSLVIKKLQKVGVNLSQAIACGDLIISNATIEVGKEQGKPVPFALFYEKLGGGIDKGGKVYNHFTEAEPGEQLKGYRQGYIGSIADQNLPEYAQVKSCLKTHNTIVDQVQRPTSDVGGVYTYEAILPGTTFRSEIKLRQSLVNALNKRLNWWELLNGEERIGQSKKDDYGAVCIEVLSRPAAVKTTSNTQNLQELTVWLLSDVLLRDDRLRSTNSIGDLAKELEKLLDVKLTIRNDANKLSVMTRSHRVDSWQARWGLPRPSLVGLAGGSCVVFKVEGTLEPSKLAEIQASGIGERRAEGYGKICFNDPILSSEISKLQSKDKGNSDGDKNLYKRQHLIPENDAAFCYARIVEKAACREAIYRSVLRLAATNDSRKNALGIESKKPTMSQLGALRSVLGRLETFADRNSILTWLEHLKKTSSRQDKWTKESLEKLNNLMLNQETIWQELDIYFANITLTINGYQHLKSELWAEAVRIFIDTCIRAHKRDLENNPPINLE